MDYLRIVMWLLMLYLACIIGIILMMAVFGFVALIINERRYFCCCFYLCEKKKNTEIKCLELPEVIIIIDPNGKKNLGIKN